MRIPAALLAIPLLVGSIAGLAVADAGARDLPLFAAAAGGLALLAAAAWLADGCREEAAVAVAIGCALAGGSLGISGARETYRSPLSAWFDDRGAADDGAPVVVEGVLREDASPGAAGIALVIDVRAIDGVRVRGGVRASVGGVAAASAAGGWRGGRSIRAPISLRRPATYRNPGMPDDARALGRRGIALVGSIKSAALVDVVARGGFMSESAAASRAWVRRVLARQVGRWDARSSGLMAAILIGDRTGLSNDDERRLQRAGTYHVIAISGGNIAILTALLLGLLRGGGVPRRWSAGIAIPALWFYAGLAGAPASVSRAVTAATLYLAGRTLDHRGPPLNAVAVAAGLAVAIAPLAPLDAGFVLSFGATVGILLGASRLMPAAAGIGLVRRAVTAARALLVATICAEIALLPVAATVFSRVTFAGMVLNFAAIPLMSVAQVAGLFTLAASSISDGVAGTSGYAAHLAVSWIVESAALVDRLPWLVRDVAPPDWWVCASYYAGCFAMLAGRRLARLALPLVAVLTGVILLSPAAATRGAVASRQAGVLRVTFLDVGQGDATLAILPGDRALLIDAGGLPGSTFDIGERVLVPALTALGVRRLDTLVLTHGDPDHIGGAAAVLRRFRPPVIWEGVPVPPHAGLRALAALSDAHGATWRTVRPGDQERIGPVEVRILHPPPPDWERQRVRNDDSVGLELRYGAVSVLLLGDIGQQPERALASTLRPELAHTPIVILKAPHHGSATSSTGDLIAATHPDAAIVSAGRHNRFGHPAPAVLSRYRQAGAAMFRTDQDGAVTLETDGREATITTMTGRRVVMRE